METVTASQHRVQLLDHCFSSVYIDICSNLSNNVKVKLSADDTFLFFIVIDTRLTFENLSNDLHIMIDWAYHSKVYFNVDKSKQAQKAIFREKHHFFAVNFKFWKQSHYENYMPKTS